MSLPDFTHVLPYEARWWLLFFALSTRVLSALAGTAQVWQEVQSKQNS